MQIVGHASAHSWLYGVSFTDANNGTAVGVGGTILRTTDGGATWNLQSSGTSVVLSGVAFTDANTGAVVGDGGLILRTTDGGATWNQQSSGSRANSAGGRVRRCKHRHGCGSVAVHSGAPPTVAPPGP